MGEIYSFNMNDIAIDEERIIHSLGYPASDHASAEVTEKLPALMDLSIRISKPGAISKFEADLQLKPGIIKIANGPTFHTRLLSKSITFASRVALFALTIGQEISDWINALSMKDILSGFIADAIASEIVEAAADRFQNLLAEKFKTENHFNALRFSPGYCDWPISEMPDLLAHIDADEIGISLTPGGMMIPQKSICGLIGFADDSKLNLMNPCELCGNVDCPHRRRA